MTTVMNTDMKCGKSGQKVYFPSSYFRMASETNFEVTNVRETRSRDVGSRITPY